MNKNKELELTRLILIGERIDKLFEDKKITKNKKGRLITQLNNEWNKWWNKYYPKSESFKATLNKLYEGTKKY